MLTELTIENFRAFDRAATLRLRPITVLIGRNSAGKSSLIKFLLMLQQSLGAHGADFLCPEGERVHLGAFSDLKNSVGKRPYLQFQLRFRTSDLPSAVERKMLEESRKGKFELDTATRRSTLTIAIPNPGQMAIREDDAGEYVVDTRVRYSRSKQSGTHSVSGMINGNPEFQQETRNLSTSQFLRFASQSTDPAKSFQNFMADRFLLPLRKEIHSWRHLSAIREESQRAIVTASPPANDVGQRGEYAMPHLQKIMKEQDGADEFVTKHMASVAEVEGLRFESSMKGYLAHCRAVNRRTGGESYLSDFGFGVSQCLPIFVQGALMQRDQLLMVEQPEAQLHPSAQLEIGSFFRDLWMDRNVMSLVETHSSQIILRLRHHVARGELKPEDVCVGYVYVSEDGSPTIKNLQIDEQGNLEKGLPMEFFGAEVREAMEMRAGK